MAVDNTIPLSGASLVELASETTGTSNAPIPF
jgi:hypothetical protein